MENLPDEVMSDILIRLLAKQLAQMRCVCKSWNIIISESSFVKSHLRRSMHNSDDILLFFHNRLPFERSPFTARPSRSPHLEIPNFIKFPVKPESTRDVGGVIGSVNGLICFYYETLYDIFFYIWNPSLSALLAVPPRPLCSRAMVFGFGFDPITDDYKLVKFSSFQGLPQYDEIYSMRKGSWELITARVPSHVIWVFDQYDVCVDGADGHLHWFGDTNLKGRRNTILTFDLGAETYGEIYLPDSDSVVHHWKDSFSTLGVLAGKLCVMAYSELKKCYELWVMDEYGVAESWVKHRTFPRVRGERVPYGFTSRNEFLFKVNDYTDMRFALYDPVAAKTKFFEIKGAESCIDKVIKYVDSLVWITPSDRSKTINGMVNGELDF